MKLIEHWATHNDEHGERFMESASEAEEIGLYDAAEELRLASAESRKVSVHLREALKKITEQGG
ncbi:MAG: hypothetical protein V1924_01495 [Candidatus Bathyarchaeota archaeon]